LGFEDSCWVAWGKEVSALNKQDLIEYVAREAKITKKQAGVAIESVLGGVSKALKKGERVTFVGFGTFSVRRRAARKARNPQTGEVIRIAAKRVPVFKAGTWLKKSVK